MAVVKKYCPRCNREMSDVKFFTLRGGEKFELCKECTCAHVDNFDEKTYLWILQKADVPYVPDEWATIRDKVIQEKGYENLLNTSVVGKYLSKMKLTQYKNKRWADSESMQAERQAAKQALLEQAENRKQDAKEKLDAGSITQEEYDIITSAPEIKEEEHLPPPTPEQIAGFGDREGAIQPVSSLDLFNENNFIPEDELPDPAAELTQDEKIELAMRWGRLYSPQELLSLEKYYQEMQASFDIHDADTMNTLRLLAKTVLKMDQSLDRGDTDTYLKLSKVADMQRKSAKFTAAQNKADNINVFDSVGAVVALCEKEQHFIPRYVPDDKYPLDKIDLTLKDTQTYLYNLVTEDLGFSQQLENAIKTLQNRKQAEELTEKEIELDSYYNADRKILDDESFEDFYESIEEQRAADAGIVATLDLSKQEE